MRRLRMQRRAMMMCFDGALRRASEIADGAERDKYLRRWKLWYVMHVTRIACALFSER